MSAAMPPLGNYDERMTVPASARALSGLEGDHFSRAILMRRILAVLLLAGLIGPATAWGQRSASPLIAPDAARQLGLERMWFTQMSVDRGRGKMVGLHQHVSATQAHTVFQVTFDGKRYVFSQLDRDAFGKE